MRVTEKQIPLDTRIVKKMDLMCERCTQIKPKLDSALVIDGNEGYGKTTFAAALGYYAGCKMKRPFSHKNMFFDIDKMREFAQTTENQIIVWDEAVLGALSTEWASRAQNELIKLMMTARKKRHFWIFNIPKFYRMKDYLADDRTLMLIHVYAREEKTVGRFVYYNKKAKFSLYEGFRTKKSRTYKKYVSGRGSFPDVLDPNKPYNILDVFDEKEYDKAKDEAIASIGNEEKGMNKTKIKALTMQYLIATKFIRYEKKEIAGLLKVAPQRITEWKDIPKKFPEVKEYMEEMPGPS